MDHSVKNDFHVINAVYYISIALSIYNSANNNFNYNPKVSNMQCFIIKACWLYMPMKLCLPMMQYMV